MSMPQKDITSINEGSFSQRRSMFSAFTRTDEKKTIDVVKQKKFYGGSNNRDASSIIAKRAVQGHNSSFALNGQTVLFQGTKTTEDARQALKRVRNGGSVVPAKKTHNYNNAPVFY
jgi:hypothetical protein